MKKIIAVLITLMVAVSAFSYEPNKDNVTVKRDKVLYEETYVVGGIFTKTRKWTYNTKSGKFTYFTAATFDDMWDSLLTNRERYDIYLNAAKYKDETCSTCAFLEKYKSAYENGELSKDEMKQYESMVNLHQATNNLKGAIEGKPAHAKTATKSYYVVCADGEKREAINKIPFVTEENWLTITEEELCEKLNDFCKM